MRQIQKRVLVVVAVVATSAAAAGCGDPPDASFIVTPEGAHVTGDVLTFTSKCRRGATAESRWDLDGDGRYETEVGNCYAHPDVQHSYDRPGTYRVSSDFYAPDFSAGVQVFLHGYSSQDVVIGSRPGVGPPTNQAPAAAFTSDANPGYTERAVHFDASSSSDGDGRIVTYEWDFTSDGSWDATGVTAAHAFERDGIYETTLRVTDDQGAASTAKRAVPIVDGVPASESLAASALTAAAAGTRFSSTLSGKVTSAGQGFINGGTLSTVGFAARGSMKLKGLPKPLERKRKARWAATFTTKQHGTDSQAKLAAEGFLLLDFGHSDRVCFSGRVAGTLDEPFTGRLAVAGGSGQGLRLRGGASLAVPLTGKTVNGRLNLARTGKARPLPKTCRSLARGLRGG